MYLWIVIAGGAFSFFAAMGIGANDAANAFATSVGSKALTLKKAVILSCIFGLYIFIMINGPKTGHGFYRKLFGSIQLIVALIYSFVCYLKTSLFIKEYKSFALKNKGKLYITGIGLSLSLIIDAIL